MSMDDKDFVADGTMSDEQLDAAIEESMATLGLDALVEEAAAEAVDEFERELTIPASNVVTRDEFEEFKAQVAKAFRHAGFKF